MAWYDRPLEERRAFALTAALPHGCRNCGHAHPINQDPGSEPQRRCVQCPCDEYKVMGEAHELVEAWYGPEEESCEAWDDRAARIVEAWEAWRAAPFDFHCHETFLFVMTEHVRGLRAELAAAGWESAR